MSLRARAVDVADYILLRLGPTSAMKLQKLVYYSQAWSLAWTDAPLFAEEIEAWSDGPVVRSLYNKHRGRYRLPRRFFDGETERLNPDQRDVIERVLKFYGPKDPQWLSNLTHIEEPWKNARVGLQAGERGHNIIPKEAMLNYYANL
ncbi:MAG TPA: type II toxin-antitoxin system antitoxin SocA domain-containing protein [Terriglobales bacterium]|nr:type II toxin-antitoxin system antitoxin SocA domain-containing protein [Terriglobales bacterium]